MYWYAFKWIVVLTSKYINSLTTANLMNWKSSLITLFLLYKDSIVGLNLSLSEQTDNSWPNYPHYVHFDWDGLLKAYLKI